MHLLRDELIDFVDLHKKKLTEKPYNCVIIHIISHGGVETFLSSDAKTMDIDFLLHEITSEFEFQSKSVHSKITVIFHHGCQGNAIYSTEDISSQRNIPTLNAHTVLNGKNGSLSHNSNYMIISGNVPGRSMSDSGLFSRCIYNSFTSNLARWIKADFTALLAEIGRDLELESNHAEIMTVDDTLRFNPVRFEKRKGSQNENNADVPYIWNYGKFK